MDKTCLPHLLCLAVLLMLAACAQRVEIHPKGQVVTGISVGGR